MVKSNEFSGVRLRDAVKAVTVAYHGNGPQEAKSFCRDLVTRFDLRKRDADHIHDRIVDIQREVDGLRQAAQAEALVTIVTALVAALGRAGSILRRLRALRLRVPTLQELERLGPEGAAAFASAVSALLAADALDEARRLTRELDGLRAEYNRTVNEMRSLAESYERGNCHLAS